MLSPETAYALQELEDYQVSKALDISEVAQLARLEARLRTFIIKRWEARIKAGSKAGGAAFKAGQTAAAINKAVASKMKPWAKDVTPTYKREIAQAYKLAKTAGHKKATKQTTGSLAYGGSHVSSAEAKITKAKSTKTKKPSFGASIKPSFTLVDKSAIEAMNEDNVFWIGEHYDRNIAHSIELAAQEIIDTGVGRTAGASVMIEKLEEQLGKIVTPTGFGTSVRFYMEGLVANSVTVARVNGQMRSFQEIGIVTYELVNPMDERTSKVCAHLNGKIYTVESGITQLEAALAADDPEDVKKIQPWKSFADLQAVSPKPGQVSAKDSADLASKGFALPPFHFRCRTTVDISDAAGSFDALK